MAVSLRHRRSRRHPSLVEACGAAQDAAMTGGSPLLAGALLCCALTTACASGSAPGVSASTAQPLCIAILPVTVTVTVHHLADIATPPKPPPTGDEEQAMIQKYMAEVTTTLTRALGDRMASTGRFQIVPEAEVEHGLAGQCDVEEIPVVRLAVIGRTVGAQAVLRVELSGYGHIKRRWLAYLIGSGVAEGVPQGAIATSVTTIWVGLAVAAEEITSEVLTWGGGACLFNAHYVPITLEAELIDSRDGDRLWHKVTFVAIDRKALKKIPKEEHARKEVQLRLTLARAERKLVASLVKAAE
jgi:hypothetical protein